jgi:homoserine O-acetyltransferase
MAGVKTYKPGDWNFQSRESIPDAEIAYKYFGEPKSPAIIYPS